MDNCISIDKIDINAISKDVANVLLPILSELEDLDGGIGSIDKGEFVNACMRLYTVSIPLYRLNMLFLLIYATSLLLAS